MNHSFNGDFERVRDDELDPGDWDADLGEFVRRPAKPSSRAIADDAVRLALALGDSRQPGRGWWLSSAR
jgi:hypothetical protein